MMKYILLTFFIFPFGLFVQGQSRTKILEGSVTYMSSQNVYVKFVSTEGIKAGDTLFIQKGAEVIPGLIVKDLSSISCVCIPLDGVKLAVSEKIFTGRIEVKEIAPDLINPVIPKPVVTVGDTVSSQKAVTPELKQNVSGRVSVSSYTGLSNASSTSQRMRYTFMLNARNINNSAISAESYIVFTHSNRDWSEIKKNVFNGLKIYSLAAVYDAGKSSKVVFGRRVNPKISSMGSVDGIQYEFSKKSFSAGVIAGTRPDWSNYGFNASLLQYGAYVSHDAKTRNGGAQTSMAFIEQTNSGKTDRRFVYMQHSNNLLPKLNLFGSAEFDLYNILDSAQLQKSSSPRMTNLYLSLRYRLNRNLSLSVSYTNRQNIIYYESYKNIIDRLLATETTQGYQAQANYRFLKKVTVGVTGSYRYQKKDPKPSKNAYAYLNYSEIPWLKAAATVSATFMETTYLSGKIFSAGLSRDIFKGKVYTSLNYRYVDYLYSSSDAKIRQNMAEISLMWRAFRKLNFSLDYEGTFEKQLNYSTLYVQLTKSF